MNVYALVHSRILAALQACRPKARCRLGSTSRHVEVAPPRDAAHGDLASNAALVLAKAAQDEAARHRRKALAHKLEADPDIEKVEVAGPGFLNLALRGRPSGRASLPPS